MPASSLFDILPVDRAFSLSQQNDNLDPSTINSLWNYSLTLLLNGDYINGCKYYEISAKTGENCHNILPMFTKHIYQNMNKNFYVDEPGIRKNVLLKLSNTKGKEWRSSCCCIH